MRRQGVAAPLGAWLRVLAQGMQCELMHPMPSSDWRMARVARVRCRQGAHGIQTLELVGYLTVEYALSGQINAVLVSELCMTVAKRHRSTIAAPLVSHRYENLA
jgi:hypothetical protein